MSAAIINIADHKKNDVVLVMENLLEQARLGKVTGIIFAAHLDSDEQVAGVAGDYIDDPLLGIRTASKVFDQLTKQAK